MKKKSHKKKEPEIRTDTEEWDSEEEIQTPGDYPMSPEKKETPPPRCTKRTRRQATNETQLDQERETRRHNAVQRARHQIHLYNEMMRSKFDKLEEQGLSKEDYEVQEQILDDEYHTRLDELKEKLSQAKVLRVEAHEHPLSHFVNLILEEPKTHRQAISGDDCEKWQQAIDAEMDALNRNHTWDIEDRPTNRKVVSGK